MADVTNKDIDNMTDEELDAMLESMEKNRKEDRRRRKLERQQRREMNRAERKVERQRNIKKLKIRIKQAMNDPEKRERIIEVLKKVLHIASLGRIDIK